jgi:hypothetical protein
VTPGAVRRLCENGSPRERAAFRSVSPSTTVVIPLILFAAMLVCLDIGYRAARAAGRGSERFHDGVAAIDAAIFALLGLLLGFSFAGAMSRLDARRQLIVREANAISTAYLRLDVLPLSEQPRIRHLFRDFLDRRLRAYQGHDLATTERLIDEGGDLEERLWAALVKINRDDPTRETSRVVLPAVNDMMDVTTARAVALQTRLPLPILALLITMAILSALVAGYAMAKRSSRSLLHMALYAAAVSTTVFVMLDLDNPRVGLIRLDATERILQELHDSIR